MLWLVGITNSINFFDNIDGGASGTIAVSGLALAIIAFVTGQSLIAAMSLVLAGATIGFLLWNKPPARIYMGDSGALFLGILIASLTVRLDSSQELGRLGLLIPVLILAIPILDTSVSVIKRLKRGVSVFQGGKDHLSHRLMRLGFQKKNAVITLWVGSTYFSSIAVWLSLANFRNYGPLISLVTISWISLFAFFVFTQDTD
jgi:UDP-GlcNAc:undecaprenyl-phosphate GlcNAc-1-phosphate transferase